MNSAQDALDPDREDQHFDDPNSGRGTAIGRSASFARQVAAKYQGSAELPMVSRSEAPGDPTGPASPDMTLAHPPNSQQPGDPVSPMEAQPQSQSTGAPSKPPDARAIADKVYGMMKKELKKSKDRS